MAQRGPRACTTVQDNPLSSPFMTGDRVSVDRAALEHLIEAYQFEVAGAIMDRCVGRQEADAVQHEADTNVAALDVRQ